MNTTKSALRFHLDTQIDFATGLTCKPFAKTVRAGSLRVAAAALVLAIMGSGFSAGARAQDGNAESVPAPFRSAYVPRAGAFEGPADPAAASVGRVSTDFGRVKVGVESVPAAVTFTFKRSATLGSVDVVTKGAKGLDFGDAQTGTCKAGKSYSAGDSCTIHVTFKPKFAGARQGAVLLKDEAGETLGVHPLFASGIAALIQFQPPTQTSETTGSLGNPVNLAIDGSGNLYVVDEGQGPNPPAVYLETAQPGGGFVQSAIGSGWNTPSSIAVDGSGNVYVTDSGTGDVYKETPNSSGYTQSLMASGFINPECLALDGSGNVYVCEYGSPGSNDGAIYEITNIGTAKGNQLALNIGPYVLDTPTGMAFDGSGNLWVADQCQGCSSVGISYIYELKPDGPGQFTSSIVDYDLFNDFFGVAVDPAGDVYSGWTSKFNQEWRYFGDLSPSNNYSGFNTLYQLSGGQGETAGFTFDAKGNIYYFNGNQLEFLDFADPPSLTFANFDPGSPDPPQTVTLTDIGNNTLRFAIPASGVNPSISNGYMLDTATGDCPSVRSTDSTVGALIPAASCALPVTFNPPAPGAYPGTLTMTDSNMQAPGIYTATQTIQLSGAEVGGTTHLLLEVTPSAYANQPFNVNVQAVDSLGNITPNYSGTIHFTSTDPSAVLPQDSTLSGGQGLFGNVMLYALGTQTITGTDTSTGSITGTSNGVNVSLLNLVVTTNQDDSGVAGNCLIQTAPGTGTDPSCSLRDAVMQANGYGAAEITFDSNVFNGNNTVAQNTITLGAAGVMNLGPYTSIVGPVAINGANGVTISGNNAVSIFSNGNANNQIDSIANLILSNAVGSAITNFGAMQLSNCAFNSNTNNTPLPMGGAIANEFGRMTLTGSTFIGNSAGIGGAIYNSATLTITNSTFAGNTASQSAGGIYNDANAVLTITNSTVADNSAATEPSGFSGGIGTVTGFTIANSIVSGNGTVDILGPYTDNGGNVIGASNINLSSNENIGQTEVLLPAPPSPAFCAGTLANATAAGLTGDQRGQPFDPLCPANRVDSGAVQTGYTLDFGSQQPPTSAFTGQPLSPAPIVSLAESNYFASWVTNPITVTDTASALSGTTSVALNNGQSTFSNLIVNSAQSVDALVAAISLNPALTPPLNLTVQSNSFSVTAGTSQPQTITFTPPSTATYGVAPIALTATSTSSLTVSLQLISGPASLNGNLLTITGAGSVVIQASQAGDSTYAAATPVQQTIMVAPALLKVTAFSYTRTYTAALPVTYAYSITGFVNGDTASAVTGQPAIGSSATSASIPGSYPITPSLGSLSAANYTFQFQAGTLTITPAVLNVTAYSYTRTYGAAIPSPFAYAITGFVNGDTIAVVSGTPAIGTSATSSSPVGTYPITPALGTLSATRYTFHFTNGTLTIAPTVLKVAAYNYTRYYRAALPSPFGYSLTGLMNGDTAATATTGTPSITTTATQGSPAATYPITASIGTFATTQNYTLEFQGATLTITPVPVLTVTAYSYTRSYGAALPSTFAYTISGFLGTDTMSIVSGAPVVGTTATSSSPAGGYAITPTIGTLSTTGNYTFQFAAGTLTIAPAILKVTAYNYTRRVGEALPAQFEYTITGFEHGDTASTAVTGAPNITTTAVKGSPAGTYPITPAAGTLSTTGNYTFTFIDGTLTITN